VPANKLYVKALPGRVARVSPRGAMIPSDQFVPVDFTPYIRRLLKVHGDIEARDTAAPKATKAKAEPAAVIPAA
jgi:hypothetical protein